MFGDDIVKGWKVQRELNDANGELIKEGFGTHQKMREGEGGRGCIPQTVWLRDVYLSFWIRISAPMQA